MISQRTVVFMDVDGVTNALAETADDLTAWPQSTWRHQTNSQPGVGRVDLTWSTAVIDHLRTIEARPEVEMTWCTTWQDLVHNNLCPHIGIGHSWPVARDGSEMYDSPPDWWKANRLRQALARPHDRVIWIDDDISHWESSQTRGVRGDISTWLNSDRLLAICPRTKSGLTAVDLERIEKFLC